MPAVRMDSSGSVVKLRPLGRTVMVLLLMTTPYVRPGGLGSPYARYLPRWSCGGLALLIVVTTVALLGESGGVLLAVLGISFLGLRQSLMTRLGGTTGDVLGAVCELTEMMVLLVPALLIN